MSDQRLVQHVPPTDEGLLAQYERLRKESPKAWVGEEVYRWLETHNLSNDEKAAGYVLNTLKFLCDKRPEDNTLKSERALSALLAEVVKRAPRFAKLWEGRAHFTIFTEPALDFASYLGLTTHDDDTKGFHVLRTAGVIFTDAQKAIDEGALTLLASVGEKGKELSEDIRDRLKRRDEICDRYFERRGVEKANRHTDWEFLEVANTIRGVISLQEIQAIHDTNVKKMGEEYYKKYPLEDTHPLVYRKDEKAALIAKTGIQEDEFELVLYDLWQSEMDDAWTSNVRVPRWARWFMVALWFDVVAPQLERERAKHPALPLVVHAEAINMLTRARLAENDKGQRGMSFPGDEIAHVDFSLIETALRGRVENGFKLFGSTTSHRVFRHLVLSGHSQALGGAGDPRVLNFKGAYARIADELGLKSKVESDKIRDIIEAMHHYEIHIGNRRERVLMRSYAKGAGPKPAELSIILGFPLLPNYVQDLKGAFENRLAERIAKRLIPLVALPPLIGRERDHGSQYTFQMAVVNKMRLESDSIVRLGGVTLDKATLEQLANMAGLPLTLLDQVIDRWTQDGNDAPKVLERVDGNVYRLAEVPAWEMMVSGATKEARGKNWAAKGLAKKNEKIAKRGK